MFLFVTLPLPVTKFMWLAVQNEIRHFFLDYFLKTTLLSIYIMLIPCFQGAFGVEVERTLCSHILISLTKVVSLFHIYVYSEDR